MKRFISKGGNRTPDWSIVNADVRHFPPDSATIFYMYNPFDAAVMAEVIDRIVESVLGKGATLYCE
jgi:hypothetical protein